MPHFNYDLNDITTWWGCCPQPEQRVFIALSELAQTPSQVIGVSDVELLMELNGGYPSEERTRIILGYPGMTVIEDSNPLCNDSKGCVLFSTSYYLGQLWSCRLAGGCQVGAPVQPPCFYPPPP